MWKTFFFRFALAGFLPLLGAAALNYFSNPYGVWAPSQIVGVNVTAYPTTDDRILKPVQMGTRPIDALILGDSKAAFALSTETYAALSGLPRVYNAGMRSARPGELRDLLERAVQGNPGLREVLLLVDYEGCVTSEPRSPGYDREQMMATHLTRTNVFRMLLSQSAVQDSLKNLQENYREQSAFPSIEPEGRFSEGMLEYICRDGDFESCLQKSLFDQASTAQEDREPQFAELVAIRNLCVEHGIRLRVIIPPVHPLGIAAYHRDWENYCAWERRIVDIFSEVLDFADCNSSLEDRTLFWDAGHMRFALGDRVLARALGQTEENFGVLVTAENVDYHLAMLKERYAAWNDTHPDAQSILDVSSGFSDVLPGEDMAAEGAPFDLPASTVSPVRLPVEGCLQRKGVLPFSPLEVQRIYAVFEGADGQRHYARAQKRHYGDIAFQQVFHDTRQDPCTYDLDVPLTRLTPGTYQLRLLVVTKRDAAHFSPVLEQFEITE